MATTIISTSTATSSRRRPTITLRAEQHPKPLPSPIQEERQQQQKTTFPFLRLPGELRNQIYELLLTSPTLPALQRKARHCHTATASSKLPRADIHPAILSTCRLIHAEASPILYARTTFAAHPSLLSKLPHLVRPSRPILANSVIAQIRHWRLAVRLDTDLLYGAADAAAAFSGADSLELDVWQAGFGDVCDYAALRLFEDVRGVGHVTINGAVEPRFARWLELVMMSPPDSDEELASGASTPAYVECDGEDGRRMPKDLRARPSWL
ncbi:hypothetical protein IWX90DRAFT_322556 [Phyllosticta citrichinensis]|uniref:2EXR domain-containing protein n=1 Tax=Phyllosticta citrichinensis TaxID=1130410 RepID=A0ABR1XJY5_9PEZI